jgi:hypothetical protein
MFVKYNIIYIQIFYLNIFKIFKNLCLIFFKWGYMEPELHLSMPL